MPLTVEKIERLYLIEKLSDREIAEKLGKTRSYVSCYRRKHNIQARGNKRDNVINKVFNILTELNFKVDNIYQSNKISTYQLLVDDKYRLKVMIASKRRSNKYYATISQKNKDVREGEYKRKLNDNRISIDFTKICDYIIFVGSLTDEDNYYWIVPSNVVDRNVSSISLVPNYLENKYNKYLNNWNILNRGGF